MKKFLGTFLSVLFFTTLTLNVFAFESTEGDYLQPISSEIVTLSAMDDSTRSVLTEEFTLYTYDDNGIILYSIDVEDPVFREAAFLYIMDLADSNQEYDMDSASFNQEYLSESRIVDGIRYLSANDGSAGQIGSVRNTHNISDWRTFHRFSGSHGVLRMGNENAREVALFQEVSINGIGITVSWPPAFNGSGNTRTWEASLSNANAVSASLGNITASSLATSADFNMSSHVLVGNHYYRPGTTVRFGTFS